MTVVKFGPSTYEWWKYLAERPALIRPDALSVEQIQALEPGPLRAHHRARRAWHAGILLRTPQTAAAYDQLDDLLDSNLQDIDRVRGAAAIDASPSLGKSTTVDSMGSASIAIRSMSSARMSMTMKTSFASRYAASL